MKRVCYNVLYEMDPSGKRAAAAAPDEIRIFGSKRMISSNVTVKNSVGLHARPATFFIQKANSYKSSIWVERGDRRVNAKSLLGVLSLGVVKGSSIKIVADGQDEEKAVNTLADLISSDFSE